MLYPTFSAYSWGYLSSSIPTVPYSLLSSIYVLVQYPISHQTPQHLTWTLFARTTGLTVWLLFHLPWGRLAALTTLPKGPDWTSVTCSDGNSDLNQTLIFSAKSVALTELSSYTHAVSSAASSSVSGHMEFPFQVCCPAACRPPAGSLLSHLLLTLFSNRRLSKSIERTKTLYKFCEEIPKKKTELPKFSCPQHEKQQL